MPAQMPTQKMREHLRKRVEDGTYTIWEPVVPRRFRKMDSRGKYTDVTVMGRKVSLP